MKRIKFYDEMEDADADYMERIIFAEQDYLTKYELLQHQNKLREQREAYERRNKTFLSEERMQIWMK